MDSFYLTREKSGALQLWEGEGGEKEKEKGRAPAFYCTWPL